MRSHADKWRAWTDINRIDGVTCRISRSTHPHFVALRVATTLLVEQGQRVRKRTPWPPFLKKYRFVLRNVTVFWTVQFLTFHPVSLRRLSNRRGRWRVFGMDVPHYDWRDQERLHNSGGALTWGMTSLKQGFCFLLAQYTP